MAVSLRLTSIARVLNIESIVHAEKSMFSKLKSLESGSSEVRKIFRWISSAPENLIPSAVLKFRISEHEQKVGLKLPIITTRSEK